MRFGFFLYLLLALCPVGSAAAAPQTLVSPVTRVSLLELYTSEGCNDCPPAENWQAQLQNDARLWKTVVPLNFHVDYWDSPAWKDPFDSRAYTERQKQIAFSAGSHVSYTPQFVLDGKDWLDYLNGRGLNLDEAPKVGVLSLTADGSKVTVRFTPASPRSDKLEVQVALLAFGVEVPITGGENQGVTLRQDFLVVADSRNGLTQDQGSYEGTLTLPAPVKTSATHYALVGWVSDQGQTAPLQAVGGFIAGTP